jgi:hypothetical protein
MAIATLPVTYSDGNVLAASDLSQNFNALNTATVPVANGGTGLTSYTSGGIIYASGTGTLASSGALTQYGVVYGGGAGATPVATAAGTTGQGLVATTSAAPTWGYPALRGYLSGLTLSNNGSDATNDIDIAAGMAVDSTHVNMMVLASALTKQLDAAWAVGTNQGGLDTGAIANTTYHVWLIKRSDTGVVDALFSTSASAPTMPTNYDYKRRIGAIVRTGGAIKAFTQDGDLFQWNTIVADINAAPPASTNAISRTLTVPVGVRMEAVVNVEWNPVTSGGGTSVLLSDLSTTDEAPAITGVFTVISAGTAAGGAAGVRVLTNTSAQIRSRVSAAAGSDVLNIATRGWIDRRGRDA